MIDIHSHILPGLDDGAKSMEETLKILSQLQESGFKTIFATPHVMEQQDILTPAEILAATEKVREMTAQAGIFIDILPGAENYIFPDLAKWAREGKLLTLGNTGRYILVELPLLEIPHYTDQVFFELQVSGLIPILAHPERYKKLNMEPERLVEWAKKGVLFQADLRSLSGKYGTQAKHLAEIMLGSDLVHFLGSDAHRISRSDLTYKEDLLVVKKIIGEKRFQDITLINPQNILKGEILKINRENAQNVPFVGKKKNRFWSLFKK